MSKSEDCYDLFNQNKFDDFIIDNKIIGFFENPIKLKSGRMSYWYVNWRDPAYYVSKLKQLSLFIIKFVNWNGLMPDCFYGVPDGATKIALITQYEWAKKMGDYFQDYIMAMGRGQPKEHGNPKDKYFVGEPKGRTIVLEDVTTTGESLLTTIDQLLEINAEVIAAIGLTNRNELRDDGKTVEQAVAEKGINYYSMSNAITLLPKAVKAYKPDELIMAAVEEYFDDYGSEQLRLM